MNPSSAGAFTMAGTVIGSLLEDKQPGLVLSIDIGESLFALVAANVAELTGCDLVRSPRLILHCARLSRADLSLATPNADGQPVFGRIDGRLRMADGDDLLESYTPWRDAIETRCIDSWMTGRPSLRLVHFGDPELVEDQIVGGFETIRRDRPVLTLYLARQNRGAIRSLLKSLDYEVFNVAAEPSTLDGDPALEFGWIAVPDEDTAAFRAAAAQQKPERGDRYISPWRFEANSTALPRQRRLAAVFGLPACPPFPLDRKFGANEIVCTSGCYPLESEKELSWRWLGPQPQSRILVPCPLPGVYTVELAVLGSHLQNGFADCRIIVEGREVPVSISDSPPVHLSFTCHVDAANYSGYMEMDIVSTGKTLKVGNDSRTLRISVESIRVSHWQ